MVKINREAVTDSPHVTVIMATYNCIKTVEAAVGSITSQRYQNWDMVICDDGSADGTYELLVKLVGSQPERFTLLRNAENKRLAYSLNRCIQVASGPIVARMDADDLSHPDRFTRQIDYLEKNPDVNLVGTAIQQFNADGDLRQITPPLNPDKYDLRRGVPFCHPTIMTYLDVYEKLAGYTVAWRTERTEDYDLWFRFYAKGYVGHNLPMALYRFREDIAAVKRRTPKARIQALQTAMVGYRLLGYPWYWYGRPIMLVLRALVPAQVVVWTRSLGKAAVQLKSDRVEQTALPIMKSFLSNRKSRD